LEPEKRGILVACVADAFVLKETILSIEAIAERIALQSTSRIGMMQSSGHSR
jgi:hypothetical protein